MNAKPRASDNHRLEHRVHQILLIGLGVSTALLLVGLAVALVRHEPDPVGSPAPPAARARAAAAGSGTSMLNLGILALIATPILRVAVLAVGWTAAGDRRFAATAIAVLCLLALGLTLGLG